MKYISLVGGDKLYIEGAPNTCPECHNMITPGFILARSSFENIEVIYSCPNAECNKMFIAYYDDWASADGNHEYTGHTSVGTHVFKSFSDEIKSISPKFEKIYNEAFAAEQQNLQEICGVGYRKALEFLIKDYCILKNEDKREEILKSQLANCIAKYVDEPRIKSVSRRAAWLGNDETHYVRTWEQKELKDLKILIDLTLHWIEAEHLTSLFEEDMPDKPKSS